MANCPSMADWLSEPQNPDHPRRKAAHSRPPSSRTQTGLMHQNGERGEKGKKVPVIGGMDPLMLRSKVKWIRLQGKKERTFFAPSGFSWK